MLSLYILPRAKNALVWCPWSLFIWKLNLQTKLWNNFLCNIDHHQFFNRKSVLCPHMQLITFVLQHWGNPFSCPQLTDGFFPGACLSTFYPHTKPVHGYKHVQALVCWAWRTSPGIWVTLHLSLPLEMIWPFLLWTDQSVVCGPPLPDCFLGVGRIELQFLSLVHLVGSFQFCMCCLFLLSACICSDVSALLLKNLNFLTISLWASFAFHLKQAQWMTLVKILTPCQYLFVQKIVSSSGTAWNLTVPW